MRCPFCGELDTKVIDSRLSHDGYSIKRRRSCPSCNSRYNTQETTDLAYPRVIKNDKSTEVFSEDKIDYSKRGKEVLFSEERTGFWCV